jgi:hypothetical protein
MTIYQIIEDLDQDNRPASESDSVTEWQIKKKTLIAIRRLYHELDLTARDICYIYGIDYYPGINKLFYKVFGPKGKGHGGSRRGASKTKSNDSKD